MQKKIHFRTTYKTALCSTPSLAEHHSRTASKAKYETDYHNPVKCGFPYEKIQLIFALLAKILSSKIKTKYIFSDEMSSILVPKKLYTSN